MSLLKNWKLILASLTLAMFTACAGSSGGSEEGAAGEGGAAAAQPQKEKIDENKLKKTEQEAMALTDENHQLRKEIFEAKNKLGIPVDRPAAE
ncbi:MAG: hypothetical protein MJY47_04880 [Fibrobacter sp.]|nr:hypothetical protein [Fibrobacter sp.]